MEINYTNACNILENATLVFDENTINSKINEVAKLINDEIQNEIPLFLTVMNGGMQFATQLLKNISHPITMNYIHASRYGNEINASSHITWFRQPKQEDVYNKAVYIVDDILDEGYTLAEIKRLINELGAKSCKLVVLVEKDLGKPKPVIADYTCLKAPNKFLFGYGMDIHGLYRQIPSIYMYNE